MPPGSRLSPVKWTHETASQVMPWPEALSPVAVPLHRLRRGGHPDPGQRLPFYLTPQQMQGVGGFTETFNDVQISPTHLRAIVDDEELRLNLA
jgi:hypothetical protein